MINGDYSFGGPAITMMAIGAVIVVVAVVAGTWYLIRNYAVGFGARSVACPHRGQTALIATRWTTQRGKSGCEVLQCSLLPNGKPVTCDMSCIAQL